MSLVSTSVTGCSHASRHAAPEGADQRAVLYDFRAQSRDAELGAELKLDDKEKRRVLSRLFPKYQKNPDRCVFENQDLSFNAALKKAQEVGAIVPQILSKAEGSFTRPKSKEKAYLIAVNECVGNPAFATRRLVIFHGKKLVLSEEVTAQKIVKTADIDGDGMQEILLEGGGMAQGIINVTAQVVSVHQGKLKVLHAFGQVFEDTCGTDFADRHVKATVLYLAPGAGNATPVTWSMDRFQSRCPVKDQTLEFNPITSSRAEESPAA